MDNRIKYANKVALYAGVFTCAVAVLLILNYLQIRSGNPLDSAALQMLLERLATDRDNQELVNEIRQLDLLARKAYFTSLWQINTGGYLLLLGAVVTLLALRVGKGFSWAIEKPEIKPPGEQKTRRLASNGIAIGGASIIILAALSAFLTADYIGRYDAQELAATRVTTGADIPVLDITAPGNVISPGNVPDDSILAPVTALGTETAVAEQHGSQHGVTYLLNSRTVLQNHNSFRGPFGKGVSHHRQIPVSWDGATGKNILWRTRVPLHGFNSPVIWGDKLFMSGADNQRRVVFCFNRHTGQLLWEREVNNIPGSPATPPRTTDDTGLAAPTMTVDGQRVFAIFGTGDIIAFDLEGNRQWAKNLGVPDNHYGHSSSLLTWDQKVFVQYDTRRGSRVLALDAATGAVVWERARTSDISWASPILINAGGQQQLILKGNPDLTAYNPLTGEVIWSVDCMSGEVGPSPAFGGGPVIAANEHATMAAVNPVTGELLWRNRHYLPEVASPVYHDGLIYIATTFAVIACFDASNGELVWEMDTREGFYSSPVMADGKIYFFDTSGNAYIIAPGREPNVIASPSLGESVFATPVFSDGRIYIRGNEYLYCIGT